MAEKLRDIIEIPEVKLVVELDDADKNPEGITSTFILTKELQESLNLLLRRINEKKGCGVFIKGNFGSGKSHFLSYLYLLLKNRTHPGLHDYPDIKASNIHMAKISLVKYPSSRNLESIILDSFACKGDSPNREEQFKEIVDAPTLIIIDELSEFLRSKQAPSSFYEDIRFLQFLGEFSFHHPLWIIASLQEWIEETGHISSGLFNRIKDRYPLRINLSSSHIEDIIDQRMVIKKEGAEEVIRGVFEELKKFYPHVNFKYEDFRKTYPLHPFTTRYLSGLTPVFSQHRGVIQFVFNQVRKILDDPADFLITPEVIFDHFEERIREIPEYSPLVRVVYDYYRSHIDEILNQPLQKEIALSALKILVLTEISPFEKRKTARDMAEILLKKISTLTSRINYEYIKDGILDPLAAHQMYVKREGEVYFIDTSVDEGIRIKGKIKAVRERFEDQNYLFRELCNLTSLPYLPLRELTGGKKYRFNWQNSLRECTATIFSASRIAREDLERFLEGIEKRLDGFFIILSPFIPSEWVYSIKDTNSSPFLSSLIFWIPRPFTEEEAIFIEEYAARNILLKDFPDLKNELKRDEPEFREKITSIYFQGKIAYASGRRLENLMDIGYLPLEKLLSHLFDQSLSELHPHHCQIMPRVDYVSSHHLNLLFTTFLRQGRITIEEAEKKALTPYIKGLLEPLGLVSKRGGAFLISLDAGNELVSHILNLASQETHMASLRTGLKKGKWGMTDDQINLILSALITSGHLIPYHKDEIMELRELTQLTTGETTGLKPGKTLPAELLSYIPSGKFIWGEVEDVPTPLTQKMMWKEATGFVRKERKLLQEVHNFINRYKDYSIFKKIAIEFALLNRLSMFLHSITLSLSPSEGIERFLSYLKENPDMAEETAYLERLYIFFSEQFQLINKYYLYLTHQALKIPAGLEEKRDILLAEMEEFQRSLKSEFSAIKEGWEEFYEAFTRTYSEGHQLYYQSDVFRLRREVEGCEEARALKRISRLVTSVTFPGEWWEVKRELDKLPESCKEDLNYELFLNPVCKCGFWIGSEPLEVNTNFVDMCKTGLYNFLRLFQLHENREKLDSYILSIKDAGQKDRAKRLSSLIHLDVDKTAPSLVLPLLTDEILQEIEKAFKGRWKVKEVRVTDFVNQVKGRRFKYSKLKDAFLRWIGEEEECIIHVKEQNGPGTHLIKEELSKYGIQGERLYLEIEGDLTCHSPEDLEVLMEKGSLPALEGINWALYPTDELIDFLQKEKIGYLKKRLRGEIFHRLWDKVISDSRIQAVEDGMMKNLLYILKLMSEEAKYRDIEVFTKVMAPLVFLFEKVIYENAPDEMVGKEVTERIREKIEGLSRKYAGSADRLGGARDMPYVKECLKGVVVVLDGLRYDLWFLLRGIMEKEGWKIKEEPFRVLAPSSTSNFRQALGIGEKGSVNGKSYALFKWAERDVGKRDLKKFLKGEEDIKFLHFNFIDTKVHNSTLDLYPLYMTIKGEFINGIVPILKKIHSFYLISDHGFTDTKRLKERYMHGRDSIWETVLPLVEVGG